MLPADLLATLGMVTGVKAGGAPLLAGTLGDPGPMSTLASAPGR